MKTKRCPRCKSNKSLTKFYKNKLTKDCLQVYCKDCWKLYCKDYRSNNSEKVKKAVKKRLNIKISQGYCVLKITYKKGNLIAYGVKSWTYAKHKNSVKCEELCSGGQIKCYNFAVKTIDKIGIQNLLNSIYPSLIKRKQT